MQTGAQIVTVYKNKEDWSKCNNYCGIFFLNIVGKIFSKIVLSRIQTLVTCIYPVTMCFELADQQWT